MNILIFGALLFGLQAIYWLIGRRSSKNVKDKKDYFLAGRKVRFFPLMMTLLATQVGGGLFLGSADEAYHFGWYVLLYPMGAALGLILLGLGIGKKLARFQVSTVAQILEVIYRSPRLKQIASILSIISLFMVLVAQVVASQKFLMALGFSNPILFVLFWGVIILYTARGGLRAVIATDIAQAMVFTVVLLICLGSALFFGSTGLPLLPGFEKLSLVSTKLAGWLLMPLFFMVIEQDIGQRCFAGSSPKTVSKASFWAGVTLLLICVIPVFFGVLAKSLGLVIPEGSSVLMIVIAQLTNPWVTALAGCAILAAIISTATSLINAISSNISNDFQVRTFMKKSNISVIRWVTAAIAIGALCFAFCFKGVVDLIIQSYELSVCCLFASIFIALFKKKGNFLSALLSIAFGVAGFVFFRIFPTEFPREILSICLSLGGYLIGEVFSWYRSRKMNYASMSKS